MKSQYYLALIYAVFALSVSSGRDLDRPWNEDVIYFAITDRFFDGDPANNRPAGSDPALFDPNQTDIDLYHGGDLRGLELALQSGYFNALGVTALWITPPVRNVWYSAFDSNDAPKTGYHGYWTQDFLDIDPHLVSTHSLDGLHAYADTREGRMQHYRDFVELAHSRGIKVIQDVVLNHAGPVFYYDANESGTFDRTVKQEWVQPFNESGKYTNMRWANTPKWNQAKTAPSSTQTIFGHPVPLSGALGEFASYGRRGMSPGSLGASSGEEILCDFLSLRDFDTDPQSEHFEALVEDFVEIYAFYIQVIGVDGLRIDTVKHVHHAFWDAFTSGLRERLGPERSSDLILFGEVYDGNPETLGRYTYQSDWPLDKAPSIDALLNFQFCYAVRDYLRTGNDSFGNAEGIATAIEALTPTIPNGQPRPYFNQTPGPDGLNASEKAILFVENHDGINRFRVRGVSARRNLLANALTLSMPGIPCLYYGTEAAIQDKKAAVHEDAETGRMTFLRAQDAEPFQVLLQSDSFRDLSRLIELRKTLPALASPQTDILWMDSPDHADDDGLFAFARGADTGEPVVVIVNASTKTVTTRTPEAVMELTDHAGAPLFRSGRKLEPIRWQSGRAGSVDPTAIAPIWRDGIPCAAITVPPESVRLFRVAGVNPTQE
mgnify:CR=1 FL=1